MSGSREEDGYYGYYVDHPPSNSIELDYSKGNITIENQEGWEGLNSAEINSIRSEKPHKKMLNEYDKGKKSKIKLFRKSLNEAIIFNFIFSIYTN